MVKALSEATLTATDGFCEDNVAAGPDHYIEDQKHCRVKVWGDYHIDADKCYGGKENGEEGPCLIHSQGKQFVVDVAFVGKEGIASVAHAMEVNAEDVEAGYDER